MKKRLSFTSRLTLAVALGGICAALLVILALCGGAPASVREAEERSNRTAEAFQLEYGRIYTGNTLDIAAVNGDGVSDPVSAFILIAKRTVHVTSLTVVTDKLTADAELTVTADSPADEEGEKPDIPLNTTLTAQAGDTGFSSEISADIPAGSWLIVTFSRELPVQAIFANYS